MNWLQQQIANTARPDTILHLGAGLCSELHTWCQSGASRIILVEPNPELLSELRHRTQRLDQVRIIAAAVGPESGQGALRLFNFPLMNSLREPTRLKKVLPGLQQIGQVTVDCLSLAQLLEQAQIESDKINWLMIDAPGEEAEILAQLEQSDFLAGFSRLFLKAGLDSLYRGAESADVLLETAQRHGFELAAAPDDLDADWVRQHLHLNRERLECERLRKQVADLKRQHEADKVELEQKNAESIEVLEQEKQRAVEECRQLEQLLDDQKKRSTGFETELKQVSSALDRVKAERNAEIEKLNADFEKQKSDVAVALKLQMLRESDLKDLQQRYGKLQETNEQQRKLLGKLHQRLSAAAEYLSLSCESDSDNNSQLADLVRALTGEGPSRE